MHTFKSHINISNRTIIIIPLRLHINKFLLEYIQRAKHCGFTKVCRSENKIEGKPTKFRWEILILYLIWSELWLMRMVFCRRIILYLFSKHFTVFYQTIYSKCTTLHRSFPSVRRLRPCTTINSIIFHADMRRCVWVCFRGPFLYHYQMRGAKWAKKKNYKNKPE